MTIQTTATEQDEMAGHLAEIRAERAGNTDGAAAAAPDADAGDNAQALTAAQPAPDAATAPTDLQAGATTEAAGNTPPAADAEDPVAQLAATRAELHRLQSDIGRVNALNARHQENLRENAQLRERVAQLTAASRPPEAPTEIDAQLAALEEKTQDFPELQEIVKTLGAALKGVGAKAEEVARQAAAKVVEPLDGVRREVQSRQEQEQQAAYDAALALFHDTYPTAGAVTQSADFQQWIGRQPSHIQHAYLKGKTPQEAMTVLDTYDAHLRRTGVTPIARAQTTNTPPAAATTAAPAPAASSKTEQTNARLRQAAGLPSRSAGGNGGLPPADDFEASREYFRDKRLREERQRAAA